MRTATNLAVGGSAVVGSKDVREPASSYYADSHLTNCTAAGTRPALVGSSFGWHTRQSCVDQIPDVLVHTVKNNVALGFIIHANVHGTGSIKIWKTRHKISAEIRIFLHTNMKLIIHR